MKKAKIMMLVIAITGILGGTLAFKANNFTLQTFYAWSTSGKGCVITTRLLYTTAGIATTIIPYSTTYNPTTIYCFAPVRAVN